MLNEKPFPTATICGMELPILADLGDGWMLAAHPNGMAIVTETLLVVLFTSSTEAEAEQRNQGLFNPEPISGVPEEIRKDAVRLYEEFVWPLVRGEFYPDQGDTQDEQAAWVDTD